MARKTKLNIFQQYNKSMINIHQHNIGDYHVHKYLIFKKQSEIGET